MIMQQMFETPFSFQGRIGRKEYILSWLIALGYMNIIETMGRPLLTADSRQTFLVICGAIPALYFFLAQSVKRCHDYDESGWMLFVPFYFIVLAFTEGKPGGNEYGPDPKSALWPGMSVQIISSPPEEFNAGKYTIEWDEKMNAYLGETSEILGMDEDGDFKLKIDDGENVWAKAWVKPLGKI